MDRSNLSKLDDIDESIALMLEEVANIMEEIARFSFYPSTEQRDELIKLNHAYINRVNSICNDLLAFKDVIRPHHVFNQSIYGLKKDIELLKERENFIKRM